MAPKRKSTKPRKTNVGRRNKPMSAPVVKSSNSIVPTSKYKPSFIEEVGSTMKTIGSTFTSIAKPISKIASNFLGVDLIGTISSLFSLTSINRRVVRVPMKFTSPNTAAAAGDVLADIPFNPMDLGMTRLSVAASCHQRYRYKWIKVSWHSGVGSLEPGELVGFFLQDPDDVIPPSGGQTNILRAFAAPGNKKTKVRDDCVWNYKPVENTNYYIDTDTSDSRITTQTRFLLMATTSLASVTTTDMGTLSFEYEIELMYPRLEYTNFAGVAFNCASTTATYDDFMKDYNVTSESNLPVTIEGKIVTVPKGRYFVCISTATVDPDDTVSATSTDMSLTYKERASDTPLLREIYRFFAVAPDSAGGSFSVSYGSGCVITANQMIICKIPDIVTSSIVNKEYNKRYCVSSPHCSLSSEVKEVKVTPPPVKELEKEKNLLIPTVKKDVVTESTIEDWVAPTLTPKSMSVKLKK